MTASIAFKRSLQLIELLQLLVASFNPRARIQGEVFSYRGFAGSVVFDHAACDLYVFDRARVMVYGPAGIHGVSVLLDPRAHPIMQSLLDEMLSEQKLHVSQKTIGARLCTKS